MAIIVEEEKNHGNIGSFIVWGVIVAVLAVAAYYLFVKRPDLVDVVVPKNVQDIGQLSKIELLPNDVLSIISGKLKSYVPPLPPPPPGSGVNPFTGNF